MERAVHISRRPVAGLAFLVLLWALTLLTTAPAAESPIRTFERVFLLEDTAEASAGVSVGDLNGDGFLDIVLAKGRHWPLFNRVLLNLGNGKFSATNLGEVPDRTYSTALADLNRDGQPDLVVSNDQPDRKLIYMNDGHGRFTVTGTFGDPKWSTRYVTLADLNGDGYPDIIAANRMAQSFVCLNDRKGAFPSCQPIPSESATMIVAADFDADGAIDLFIPHREGGQSTMLWNDGKGKFPQTTIVGRADTAARVAAAGDLNGDGRPDLVVCDEKKKTIFLYLNSGGRRFGEPALLSRKDRTPYAVAIADLNRDGKPDVVVGYLRSRGSVFFNDGLPKNFREIPWNDGNGDVYEIAFGDLDRDGWPDIIAARTDAPNAVWFSTKATAGR